jgi:ferritin-like metal-binding protein YciE
MTAEQKIVQYLNEAHAQEVGLTRVLQAQIAMTPRGAYRKALERHLDETREHARRVEGRLGELGESGNPLQVGLGLLETVVAQGLAFAKTPLDIVRGTGGEEKVLKNAKDAASTEMLEIATYDALERLATVVGDRATATLAAKNRAEEERFLARVRELIPSLTDDVVRADVEGERTFDVTKTGAADAARGAARGARRTARGTTRAAARRTRQQAGEVGETARRTARQARRVPGVAQAEGEAKGVVAREEDLPIARYDSLNADQIVDRLAGLSQVDLGKIDAYERKTQSRSTILERIEALRGDEPWPGYDEQSVSDITSALAGADDDRRRRVLDYERRHKDRAGVIRAAQSEPATAS